MIEITITAKGLDPQAALARLRTLALALDTKHLHLDGKARKFVKNNIALGSVQSE
jgi:hypothetical protein